jgi:hypothetical protein
MNVRRSISTFADSVPHLGWTLERFGLTPGKLARRVSDREAPRVLCVSIPKSGTHLLERALCLHPSLSRRLMPTVSDENVRRYGGFERLLRRLRPGQIVASHLRYRPGYPEALERAGARAIFLSRDPRDVVVSQIHYVTKRTDHRHHGTFAAIRDDRERLRLAIEGDPSRHVVSVADRLRYYEGWLDAALVIRFEDLIGPQGGGSAERQLAALGAIFEHLGMPHAESDVRPIAERLFSPDSPTFRRGSIGGWREAFDPALTGLFERTAGTLAARYGYDGGP